MSLDFKPNITIITISLNSEKYLEETISSVLSQNYQDIEYIIIDGKSTDRTTEIIKKYDSQIDQWISEPDRGIADAMNKGLSMARGDYILFLHSDDYLLKPDVIEKLMHLIKTPSEIVMCNIYLEKNGKTSLYRPRGLNWWVNFKTGIFHQSVFCSRKLFDRIGNFDTHFKITMDYDFFLRAYHTKASVQKVDMPLSVMRLVGISSQRDWPNLKNRLLEEKRVHYKNCTSPGMKLIYNIYWFFYPVYKRCQSYLTE